MKDTSQMIRNYENKSLTFENNYEFMSNQTKITDLSYLRSFTGGANDKMAKHIRMFLTGTPISIQQMELYMLSKDWSGVKQTAHALKPQLEYFGAKGSESLIKEIERISGDQTELEKLPSYIENFRLQFEQINLELEIALHELGN